MLPFSHIFTKPKWLKNSFFLLGTLIVMDSQFILSGQYKSPENNKTLRKTHSLKNVKTEFDRYEFSTLGQFLL